MWYVLRTKLATIPKMPLPNNIIVDGSGARERGFSVWSGMAVTVGCVVGSCAETVASSGMIVDSAAPAAVTKKMLAVNNTAIKAMLKILSLLECGFWLFDFMAQIALAVALIQRVVLTNAFVERLLR